MTYTHPDDPISTFEDLDSFERPEDREEQARRSHRREAIVGIGLLLIIAWIAFGQWRDAQTRQDAYHNGERAVSAYDWHAAERAFSSIPGYRDANERAAEAAHMITYTTALSGTVAVRTEGDPPGLYYNGAGGWHNLPGSDLQSRILASCPNGDLAYDAPWFGTGQATATPESGRLPARRILIATRLGQPVSTLSIDANPYDQFICTGRRMWAAHASDIISANGDTHSAAPYLLVQYQDFAGKEVLSPRLPALSWVISAIMPDGDHLLLADPSGAAGPGLDWHTKLYLANADGSNPVPLGDFPGAPGPPPYSSVDDQLLFTMYQPVSDDGKYINTVLLIGNDKPKILATAHVTAQFFDDHFKMGVHGISTGMRAGQVLTYWPESTYTVIQIVDTKGAGTIASLRTSPFVNAEHLLSIDPSGGSILLNATNASMESAANILYIDSHNTLREIDLAVSSRPGRAAEAWVRKGRIVYSSGMIHIASAESGGPFAYIFQTLPLNQLPDTRGAANLNMVAVPGVLPAVGLPWHIGLDMFAYLTPSGEVHAMNYDGSGDIALDHGIAVFSQYDTDTQEELAFTVVFKQAP